MNTYKPNIVIYYSFCLLVLITTGINPRIVLGEAMKAPSCTIGVFSVSLAKRQQRARHIKLGLNSGSNSIKLKVEFSETVKNFTENDIKIKNGIIDDFESQRGKGAASRYSFMLSPRFSRNQSTISTVVNVSAGAGHGSKSLKASTACKNLTIQFNRSINKSPVSPTAASTPANTTPFTPSPIPTQTFTVTPRNTLTAIATYTATHIPIPPTSTPTRTHTIIPVSTPTQAVTAIATPQDSSTVCDTVVSNQATTVPIFPGAEGFGTYTTAGSGRHLLHPCTKVFKVINLDDKGTGSLRECIEARGPRTCVFEVGGVIWSTKALKISNPFITIAGQTAPLPGIIIRGAGMSVEASDVLIQHLKIRLGDDPRASCCKTNTCSSIEAIKCTQDTGSRDGINTYASSGPVSNIVYDHISISWALDEGWSIAPAAGEIKNVTFSNSMINSGLDMSIHPEANVTTDPGHSKAVLISGAYAAKNISFHKNILLHNAERNIRIATMTSLEYVNNLVYNWGRGSGGGRLIEGANAITATHLFDLIGNIYLPGLDSYCPETNYRPELCSQRSGGIDTPEQRKKMHYILRVGSGLTAGLSPLSRYYLADNQGPTKTPAGSEWDIVDRGFFINNSSDQLNYPQSRAFAPVASSGTITVLSGNNAYTHLLNNSGALPQFRDSIDSNAINNIQSGTGRIINCVSPDGSVRCQKNAGGWPDYTPSWRQLVLPSDINGDTNGNQYTNLEDWLHSFLPETDE